jgi:hypothetical protein
MTWMSALGPWQWLLLGLIPPLIILLYFLKLRRTPLEVPSTYLWTKTIEDLHVNSIWQKLRNSLLLILQLLVVLFLMLSLLRPGCQGDQLEGEHFIFMIDNSASMSATDLPSRTRLEDAKDQIRNMIDRMESDDKGMLISFSNASRVLQSYTKNKSQLKKRLNEIEQSERTTDIREALLAASALANPGRTSSREDARDFQVAEAIEAQLHIFSDGSFPNVDDFSLGNLQAEYHPIGGYETVNNVGITAFSISNDVNLTGKMQAFAQFTNAGLDDRTVNVTLYVDDEVTDARSEVAVSGQGNRAIDFDLTALVANLDTTAKIKLVIEEEDDFMLDNVAYNVVNPPRLAKVLIVTDQNPFLRMGMETERSQKVADISFESRSFLEKSDYEQNAALGLYDLVIYDQCSPKAMPECNTLFFNDKPKSEEWTLSEPLFPTRILDANTTHPVMNSLNLTKLRIANSRTIKGPKATMTLLESTAGPIMAIAPRGGFEDCVVGFPLVEYAESGELIYNTDWGSKLSFPIFLQNVLEVLAGGSRFQAMKTSKPGDLVKIRTPIPTEEVRVTGPGGVNETIKQDRDNVFVFTKSDLSGIYDVDDAKDDLAVKKFAVNLMDVAESRLAVSEKLEIGFEEIQGTEGRVPARNEYWTWLALVALAILLIEWLVYNRRVFI